MGGIEQLAETVATDMEQRLPGQRKTQRGKLALLVATMLQVRSANLMDVAACLPRPTSSSPFDLSGVSVTGEAGSDDLARAGAGRLSLIQRRYGGARPLDRRRAALLRGLPRPAHGTQRLLRHGRLRLGRVLGVLRPEPLVSGPPAPACGRARPLQRKHPVRDEPHPR